MDYYEMRRGREVLCSNTAKNMGYPIAWLRNMELHGIYLYKNGKRMNLCEIG